MVRAGRDDHKLELRLWLRLLATTKLVSQEIRRRLRLEFDATLPQFDILAQLYREPDGLRLGELSKRTMVTNGNVTGIIDRLVADDLVQRTTPDDRRVTIAKLTARGHTLFSRMAEAHERWLKELLHGLPDDDMRAVVDGMGQLKRYAATIVGEQP
ncbi:MAG: MarR family transcriptional regulator [Devosia sp.]|nr:MarR family transcriptional regulator [Devosia sp.]